MTGIRVMMKSKYFCWNFRNVCCATFHVQTFFIAISFLSSVLEANDSKSASAAQRKIVMKGCNGQWLHAVRQIIMNLEKQEVPDEPTTETVESLNEN